MPTLVLARHCHASPHAASDVERPLTDEGVAESQRAAAYLARLPISYLVSSAAVRAQQTAAPVRAALEEAGRDVGGYTDSALYHGGVGTWLEAIGTIPADAAGAYIVGHQPTVSAVVGALSQENGIPDRFSPSTIAVFDLPSWDVPFGEYPAPEIVTF